MPGIDELEGPVRKVLPIFYVIDTSGSMTGAPIAAVNNAMGETMRVLQKVGAKNTQAEIRIAAMTFDSDVRWVTNGLEYIEDFFWNDVNAGGLTRLGAALDTLNEQMSRHQMLVSDVGFKLPILIFMSDGAPNDDYRKSLQKIQEENKWFKYSTKIAIAIGDDADRDVLAEVTGSTESVIAVNDLDTLEKLIVVISATASKIGSVSKVAKVGADGPMDGENNGGSIVGEVVKQMGNDDDIDVDTSTPDPVAPVVAPTPATPVADPGAWPDDDWD